MTTCGQVLTPFTHDNLTGENGDKEFCKDSTFEDLMQYSIYCNFHTIKKYYDNKNNYELKEYLEKKDKDDSQVIDCRNFLIPPNSVIDGIYISKPVNFSGCKFLGKCIFKKVTFAKEVLFIESRFDEIRFDCVTFNRVLFNDSKFFGRVYFVGGKVDNKQTFTLFQAKTSFYRAVFYKEVDFSGCFFEVRSVLNNESDDGFYFTHAECRKVVKFDWSEYYNYDYSMFSVPKIESNKNKIDKNFIKCLNDIPVRLDHTVFENGVIFRGEARNPFDVGLISFKGIDLSKVELHNVVWLKKGILFRRNSIIDENILCNKRKEGVKFENFEEVLDLYDSFRKYFESRLSYDQASDFFLGKMEVKTRQLWNKGGVFGKLKSLGYYLYRVLNLYGESTYLPIVWSLAIIIAFTAIRYFNPHSECDSDPFNCFITSASAYAQFPRADDGPEWIPLLERIISLPILGMAIKSFAVEKRFESPK